MMRALVILRPIEAGQETARRAKEQALRAIVDPLFVIESLTWTAPPAADFDALMLTSANAVKYGGTALVRYRHLPVLAVGEATAQAARKAGFQVAVTGNGGAENLLQSLPTDQYANILRLTGKDHVKLAVSGHEVTMCRVYQSRALSLGEKAQAAIQQGQVILLYSVRAAEILACEMSRLGLDRSINHIVALSPNIAQAAGRGWKSVQAADRPSDDALLSLAGRLCLP